MVFQEWDINQQKIYVMETHIRMQKSKKAHILSQQELGAFTGKKEILK